MRHQLKHRKRPISGKHEVIKDRKSISLRSKIVGANEEFGPFEIDLIMGADQKGAILIIVEMKVKLLFIIKLKGKMQKNYPKS